MRTVCVQWMLVHKRSYMEEKKTNVKSLFTGEDISVGPNEHLVALFEEMLAMAKSGALQSFIGTGFTSQDQRVAMWGDYHMDRYQMLGSLDWLVHEYVYRETTLEEEYD